eukprot:3592130-Rhodomonas_salina.1
MLGGGLAHGRPELGVVSRAGAPGRGHLQARRRVGGEEKLRGAVPEGLVRRRTLHLELVADAHRRMVQLCSSPARVRLGAGAQAKAEAQEDQRQRTSSRPMLMHLAEASTEVSTGHRRANA